MTAATHHQTITVRARYTAVFCELTDDAWTTASQSATQTITDVEDTQTITAPRVTITSVPVRLHGEVTIEEVSETIAGLIVRRLQRTTLDDVCDSDHHGRGHDCSRVHERSCRLHGGVF